MILSDTYDGSKAPFEGDLTVALRSIPVNARIRRARATVTPIDATEGVEPFAEVIAFRGNSGDRGATKTVVPGGWVEVDFHARRILLAVKGTALNNTTLQVDLGGAFVEINKNGAIKTPSDPDSFKLPIPSVPASTIVSSNLPPLTVTKLKLTKDPATPGNPDISEVKVRSTPTNISLRLDQKPAFWTRVGEMTQPESTPDFTLPLQAFLAEAKAENGYYVVPLVLHSDSIARLAVALEIEFLVEERALGPGLSQVILPFDLSGLPKAEAGLIKIEVPANKRISAEGTTAHVNGSFDDTRVVFGPIVAAPPDDAIAITPAVSVAQPIFIANSKEDVRATAIDLLLGVTRNAKLQLDLRDNLDGKPDNVSLLPRPVTVELVGLVGSEENNPIGSQGGQNAAARFRWASVRLLAEFEFNKNRAYWLVLQSLDGEALWSVTQAAGEESEGEPLKMQRTEDGGLSWREATAAKVNGPPVAAFRLRRKPERFEIPIELEIGEGKDAVRVSLDRFQPLGRVDFQLDPNDLAGAINSYLEKTAPPPCPETEHIANGDFEQWLRLGDTLRDATTVRLNGQPTAIDVMPDGKLAYIGLKRSEGLTDSLQLLDADCDRLLDKQELKLAASSPLALIISPDGARAYAIGEQVLTVIDATTRVVIGDLKIEQGQFIAMALSPDGSLLYVSHTDSTQNKISTVDTITLEQKIKAGQPELNKVVIVTSPNLSSKVAALAVSPDGGRVYAALAEQGAGTLLMLDAATLKDIGNEIPVGNSPSAVAISPDGNLAVIANRENNTVSIVDTTNNAPVQTIPVGNSPVAATFSPDGTRAYVVNNGPSNATGTLSVIDIEKRIQIRSITVGRSPVAIAITQQGDKIYVANEQSNSLTSIQIGMRSPVEWDITSGRVTPVCAPAPFHLVAVLGDPTPTRPMPTSISQRTPVAESCVYDFEFWAISNEQGAVAEILWLNTDCGLIKIDNAPIEVLKPVSVGPSFPTLPAVSIESIALPLQDLGNTTVQGLIAVEVGGVRKSTLLLHHVRLTAPEGANQAEVRFTVPASALAAIDCVSMAATTEIVQNSNLALRKQGQLDNWALAHGTGAGLSLIAVKGGIQMRNAGSGAADLVQEVSASPGRPFVLEFQGQAAGQGTSQSNSRLEVRWFKDDGSPTGSPTVLEIASSGFGSSTATGKSPDEATKAEIHLLVPARTTQDVKRISLRFLTTRSVPMNFISQAPGELSVSDLQVAFENVEPSPPPISGTGLCKPTRQGQEPGEPPNNNSFCCSCEEEHPVAEMKLLKTDAGRPATLVQCANCGAASVSFAGKPADAARPLILQPLSINRTVVRPLGFANLSIDIGTAAPESTIAETRPDATDSTTAQAAATSVTNLPDNANVEIPTFGAIPLEETEAKKVTATELTETPLQIHIKGISEKRIRQLAEIGIDSVEKLANSTPKIVGTVRGVSEKMAARFILDANNLLSAKQS